MLKSDSHLPTVFFADGGEPMCPHKKKKRLRILGNKEILRRSQIFTEL